MIKADNGKAIRSSHKSAAPRITATKKVGDASLLGTRMKELDREFNRQSRQLADMAKKLKGKLTERL